MGIHKSIVSFHTVWMFFHVRNTTTEGGDRVFPKNLVVSTDILELRSLRAIDIEGELRIITGFLLVIIPLFLGIVGVRVGWLGHDLFRRRDLWQIAPCFGIIILGVRFVHMTPKDGIDLARILR